MTTKPEHCRVEGCKREYRAKGFCGYHFKKWRRGEMPKKTRYKTCVEENCRNPRGRWGVCDKHFAEQYGTKAAPEATPAIVAEAAAEKA